MSIETVLHIAQQLHAEGKQPSVALIKARLPAPCPMPDVISGLQRWRQQSAPANQPSQAAANLAEEQSTSQPAAQSLATSAELQQLRDEVAALREEIVMLRRSIRLLAEQSK
ncbi:MAG: hypothetical protein QMB40_07835 [Aeromonadaceae bacterium]